MFQRAVKTKGFTLIEVLVSMVIFAVGFLGLASMQGIALKRNTQADLRTLALFYANDMVERVRARCGDESCSIASVASAEKQDWNDALSLQLPGGEGTYEVVDSNSIKVILKWEESLVRASAGESGSETQTLEFTARIL